QVRARLSVDGKATAETPVAVGAHESADAIFSNLSARGTASLAEGGVAAVTIDDPDGIQADNARYALMSGASRPAVLVATTTGDLTREAFYLQQALIAGRSGRPDVAGVSAAKLSAWSDDQIARHEVILLLSTRGLEPRGRE